MKTIAWLLMLAFMASGIYADNQVVERKYRKKAFKNTHLGIVSLSVNGKFNVKFLGSKDWDELQTMVYQRLRQGLPSAFQEASSCSQTEICTTAILDSVSPRRLLLDHEDTMYLNLPLRMHFTGRKDTWPKHCLVLEITEVYDDSSTRYLDVPALVKSAVLTGISSGGNGGEMTSSVTVGGGTAAGVPMGTVISIPKASIPVGGAPVAQAPMVGPNMGLDDFIKEKEIPEECLHYSCKYAFIDCGNNALVCYGQVSAEGCGISADRYGPTGVWTESLRELVTQIVEDSPYQMKNLDASDFH